MLILKLVKGLVYFNKNFVPILMKFFSDLEGSF